jgi:hypothetical protein
VNLDRDPAATGAAADGTAANRTSRPGLALPGGRQLFRGRKTQGTTKAALDREQALAWLSAAGENGQRALVLHDQVERGHANLVSLTRVTTPLAAQHVQRLRVAMPSLSRLTAYALVRRGYTAHLLVEADPGCFGAARVPDIVEMPPLDRDGAPRRELLTFVVKVTLRSFGVLRGIPPDVWEGLAVCTTWRIHDDVPTGPTASPDSPAEDADADALDEPLALLSQEVIEGLLRFGWVLRATDLAYGMEPAR